MLCSAWPAGCTFGKGNLQLRDYGKQVYTVHARTRGAGVRVVYHGRGVPAGISGDRERLLAWILAAPPEDIVTVSAAPPLVPERAQIRRSVPCATCGESVMETRVREVEGRPLCIPCAEALSR